MSDGGSPAAEAVQALLDAAGASVDETPTVAAGADGAETAARLDAVARRDPPLVLVDVADDLAAAHVEAWTYGHPDWLVLADPPAGRAVLAPVSTLAGVVMPGDWHGGRPGPLAVPAAGTARAALVDSQRNEADRLRATLLEERAWVAAEAERVRASQSWRVGHRLVRTARLLTFRRDHGTDALGRLVERMSALPDP